MADKRKPAYKARTSQAVKDARKNIRAIRKRSKELLKKANRDLRSVRSDVAALKKAGMVSSRIDARSYQPSRYMLKKIRDNRDVIEGKVLAIKASPAIRRKYVEKGLFEERGGSLIVPKDRANQTGKIKRGLIEVSRPLKNGEEQRLILPFKVTDMQDLAEKVKVDPTIDGMKRPDELFGFRLYGHNMNTFGFPDADHLAEYILTRYAHLFSGKEGKTSVKYFELIKFKAKDSTLKDGPENKKVWTPRKKRATNEFIMAQRRKRDAARKAKQRAKETPEQTAKRLKDQKRRSAINRERKFLDD